MVQNPSTEAKAGNPLIAVTAAIRGFFFPPVAVEPLATLTMI
jgi:hypothetical protein